jgi:hypothetical protein
VLLVNKGDGTFAEQALSQRPADFGSMGLADAKVVDSLTIRWPSGKVQVFKGLKGDRHIVVDESKDGADAVETVIPGEIMAP